MKDVTKEEINKLVEDGIICGHCHQLPENCVCEDKGSADDETDEEFVVSVRWLDGLFESFNAKQIRISEGLMWMRLRDDSNRNIPLMNVRWYSVYPESHEEG